MCDHQKSARSLGSPEHRIGRAGVQGDGFLDQHVLARVQGRQRRLGMQMGRIAHIHEVDVRIAEQVIERRILFDT